MCIIFSQANPNQLEAELSNGLIMGHAYTVTSVTMVSLIIKSCVFMNNYVPNLQEKLMHSKLF
jgi:hypothetical protein